jgi:diguanylate cyclase (GGDEF)-like protein/PAS domain S-box-containing protein
VDDVVADLTQSPSSVTVDAHDVSVTASTEPSGQIDTAALLDDVSDAIVVYARDGSVLWASEALHRRFGHRPDRVVGSQLRLALDDEAAITEKVTAAAREGRDEVTVRVRIPSRDGEPRWADVTSRFVRDASGAVQYAVALLHDVTDLVEAEAHYRLLAENASDVVFEMGLDGTVLWVSPSVERVLGWSPEAIVGLDATTLTHPDDRAMVRRARELDRAGAALVTDFRFRRGDVAGDGDDAYAWASAVSHDLRDPAGELVSRVVIFNLEPDELRIERALHRAERARMRAVLDSELDPRVLLEALRDRDGTIVDFLHLDVNRAAADWHGVAPAQLLGESLTAMFPAPMRDVLVSSYAEVVTTGEPLVLDEVPMAQLHKDGTERWFDVRAVRIDDGVTVTWRDVTDRHRATVAVAESEERYRLLALNVQDVVLHVVDDEIRWASPSLTEVLGWSPHEWVGRRTQEVIHQDDLALIAGSWTSPSPASSRVIRVRVRAANGVHHWAQGQAGVFLDARGVPEGIIVSFRLVDAEVAAEEVLLERAQHDDLTGLLNRAELTARLTDRLTARRRKADAAGLAVAFCDLDGFKNINDTYGHAVGDEVLRVIAGRMTAGVRHDDLVGRFGGDEMLVVLDGVSDLADAVGVAEKLRLRAAVPIALAGGRVEVTLSVGVALASLDEGFDALVARADNAMFEAKHGGRNRVVAAIAPEPLPGL